MESANFDDDHRPAITAAVIILMVFSYAAAYLRLWSRLLSNDHRLWWDDWIAFATLPLITTFSAILLHLCANGYGLHASQVPSNQMIKDLKDRYAIMLIANFSIMLPKYSVLFFYTRIFKTNSRNVRASLWATAALVTAVALFALMITLFGCTPIKKSWLPETPGHCVEEQNVFLATTICNIVVDALIMMLPVPILWNSHTGRSRRIGLIVTFLCGYCVILVSLGRLVTLLKAGRKVATDITWNPVPYILWAFSKGPVTIISINFPNAFHMVQYARRHGFRALFTRRCHTARFDGRSTFPTGRYRQVVARAGSDRIVSDEFQTKSSDQHLVREIHDCNTDSVVQDANEPHSIELTRIHTEYDFA